MSDFVIPANETVLVTGAAGFIGSHLCQKLLDQGSTVIGLDNVNDYYDVTLKEARLARLEGRDGFKFVRMNLEDRDGIADLFATEKPTYVVNLAA